MIIDNSYIMNYDIRMSDYIKTLEYYFKDESHIIFEKYTIDTLGIIKHKISGQMPSYGNGEYNVCVLYDNDGKQRTIRVARAVASTFLGKPPTPEHTVDHIESKQKRNDALTNIRWHSRPGQRDNQNRQDTLKSACIIVKDGVEKTVSEWVAHMNDSKTLEEHKFTYAMISMYAQRKTRGFAYKKYPDLEGEEWREIEDSRNKRGHWEISDMNRVKFITPSGTENILCRDRLGRLNGYPFITINGKMCMCHILAFEAFNPTVLRGDMMVLHEDDDKEDFRPHKLRLGTQSDNMKDSHVNGKRDGTKTARMKCASYIDGEHEENHDSQHHAVEYLKTRGYPKAIHGNISQALADKRKSAYGRTWKEII